ncbi:hypothetical protein ONE63_000577 [Megalurothrips usitatus]|uniref:FZ domain-containing protein n=1 Tax=Megalurothrips usitatus TaxID=439358 RepID=A0AAV7Y5P6_9NEOP|nr:hypothetical protein ONE63_000577 [Megalurothrips usitatus]
MPASPDQGGGGGDVGDDGDIGEVDKDIQPAVHPAAEEGRVASSTTSTSTSAAPPTTASSTTAAASSTSPTTASAPPSTTAEGGPRVANGSSVSQQAAVNQTRAGAAASQPDDDEEMVYDTDELVIEGDDGDAEYEGDTEQTLPEFLESILSLWSSSPAPPKVLNGHRYGDTQAGDQWPVASSPSPASSTRPPTPVVSPTLPPRLSLVHRVTPTPTPTPEGPADDDCESPRLPLCRGLLPYDLTLARPSVPQVPALRTAADLHAALPYFELVAQSGCSARVRAFLCPLLEPECVPRGVQPRRPCRRLCRAVAEDCQDFILNNLDLSRVFDCSYYPDAEHGDECLDLSAGGGSCLPREFSCGGAGGSCIPQRWLCDGRADCADGADERNCTTVCPDDHFRCKSSGASGPGGVSCVRASLRCDGRQDCADGSDEVGCAANTGAAALGGRSPCPADELRCLDGHCIGLHMLCDGQPDCGDAADERHCPASTASAARVVRRAKRSQEEPSLGQAKQAQQAQHA